MSACLLIRKIVSNLFDRETAEKISILYGGSVDNKNAFDFVDKTGMNGLLIGGASLNGSEFVRIVKLFE
jgi:triosephosphate isomerase